MMFVSRLCAIFLILFFFTGCGLTTQRFSVDVHSKEKINIDDNSQTSSVVLKVFYLTSDTRFNRLTVDSIMNKTGKEIFGSVLLGEDEYTVLPKSTTEISKKIPLDAEYVGFAVLFRKPLGTQWKLLIKAEEAKGRKILIAECSVRDVSDSEDWHIEEIKHQIELKNSCML